MMSKRRQHSTIYNCFGSKFRQLDDIHLPVDFDDENLSGDSDSNADKMEKLWVIR